MGFCLKRKEKLSAGIRRLAREQVETILYMMGANEPVQPTALHEARKGIKRIRALLHMVRGIIPEETFRRENQFYRQIGRALSPGRDAAVFVATIKNLQRHAKKKKAAVRLLVEDLIIRERAEFAAFTATWHRFEQPLRAAMERIDYWNLSQLTCNDLQLSAKQTYKEGRRKFARARKNPTGKSLHAWRKQVKNLGYYLCVVKVLGRGKLDKRISGLKSLGECIGEYHDLVMLNAVLKRQAQQQGYADLKPEIKERRSRLEKRALKQGCRMYSDKPNTFAACLKIIKRS